MLQRLKEVSVFPGALPKKGGMEDLLGGGKAHLVFLMPEIVDCTATKETDLIDAFKDILFEYSRILLGEANS